MDQNTTFIGLDVSKDTIAVAVAEGGRRGEVRFYGSISSKPEAITKLVKTLAATHGKLAFAYEAGPTGYGLYRQLIQLGYACHVVAPSMTPARPGNQIKTDRRDAVVLASLFRAGELTSIWVPDIEHEAMRELVRARISAVESVRRTRQQLLSFLLRHGRIYKDGIRHWTKKHRRWLGDQRFDHPAQQIAFEEYNRAIEQAEDRRLRLERQIEALLPSWSLHPVVASIQALRGVSLVSAVTLVAEVGDFRRFANPRQLMGWLGLVPRERSSGSTRAQGNITKAGNTRARRMLVESAWTYRLPARVAGDLLQRSAKLPEAVRDIAWKAQVRLCARYRRMQRTGRPKNIVTVAIARELAAFVWAIAIQTPAKSRAD
jgi:transposase